MEEEDLPSIRHTSTDSTNNTVDESKASKRERLKDVFNRTKTKINKVREEQEVKKQQRRHDKEKTSHELPDDVNDFLAAGRPSINSSDPPSTANSTMSRDDDSSTRRPSTSDSKTQQSPRRIAVPRIDVSMSQRFPNAKDISQGGISVQQDGGNIMPSHSYGGAFLKPAYKFRSQSSSSIASQDRKARIRGLSVGFVESSPVIIGEGGDEAMTPPLEISKAKARARSASPQGRKPLNNTNVPTDAQRPMFGRGASDGSLDSFEAQPLSRVQTGWMSGAPGLDPVREMPNTPTGAVQSDQNFVPRAFRRTQTTGSDLMTQSLEKSMKLSSHNPIMGNPGGANTTESFEKALGTSLKSPAFEKPLTKEFEMTLGLSPTSASPLNQGKPGERKILAPKPQRAPPSYTMIEGGSPNTSQSPLPPSDPQPSQMPFSAAFSTSNPQISPSSVQQAPRKPVPVSQTQQPQQQYHYPPPEPRQRSRQENGNTSDPASRILAPVITTRPDHLRSFADRQWDKSKINSNLESPIPPGSESIPSTTISQRVPSPQSPPRLSIKPQSPFTATIRRVTPSEKLSAFTNVRVEPSVESPSTATDPSESALRFYENVQQ